MELGTLLAPDSRVIDLGPTSAALAHELAAHGHHRYLGLVPADQLAAVRATAGPLAHRFHALASPRQAVRCSTDVLVIRAPYRELLWAVGDLRHLRTVVVEHGRGPGMAAWARARASSVTQDGAECDGALRGRLLTLPSAPRSGARRYLSPVVGIAGLVRRLDEAAVSYAVLRWFDELPHLSPDEDLDMLVRDVDLDVTRSILEEEPGIIPVDLYSESGTGGTEFRNAAYYPPALAGGLLARAVVHTSGLRVPAAEDHLHSLAYHAVYHKGVDSGIPTHSDVRAATGVDHDYVGTIERLARDLDRPVGRSLEDLDSYLASVGWRPPADTLRRLAEANPWLGTRTAQPTPDAVRLPVLSTFLLRERAAGVVSVDEVLRAIEHRGFDPLVVHTLDEEQRRRCADLVRGGNWGPGPFPVSGGAPALAIVAAHFAPEQPSADTLKAYPRLQSYETVRAKVAVRELVADRVPASERFNPMHSSDDEAEAWEYAELALPAERVAELHARVAGLRAVVPPAHDVVEVLSCGRRAKVEVVERNGVRVVRKTYWPGFTRFRDREAAAIRQLSPLLTEVPPLLDEDESSLSVPLFTDHLRHEVGRTGPRLLPLDLVRSMVEVLRRIYEEGLDVIDAKPDNFVLDPRAGLKIVDLEFAHEHPARRPAFVDSWALVGAPHGTEVDHPVGARGYEARWLPTVGMSRRTLVEGGVARQHAERMLFRIRRAVWAPRAVPRVLLRQLRALARRARRRIAWSVTTWGRRRIERLVPRVAP